MPAARDVRLMQRAGRVAPVNPRFRRERRGQGFRRHHTQVLRLQGLHDRVENRTVAMIGPADPQQKQRGLRIGAE